jgi:hypothetical protein
MYLVQVLPSVSLMAKVILSIPAVLPATYVAVLPLTLTVPFVVPETVNVGLTKPAASCARAMVTVALGLKIGASR